MVIAFLQVLFSCMYHLRLALSDLHTSDSCKTWISVRLLQIGSIVDVVSCSPLGLIDHSDLRFGPSVKKKKPLCSLMRKLTSANPHEASPVTSSNHDLYMCFTSVHPTDASRSLPHDCLTVVPGGFFLFFYFLFSHGWLALPLTDAVQTSKPFAAGG